MIDINTAYYNWLAAWVMREPNQMQYTKLIEKLYSSCYQVFPMVPNDMNRLADGHDLRYKFAMHNHLGDYKSIYKLIDDNIIAPVNVLETLVALSIRADEGTTYTDHDRSYLWFWEMIKNMNLAVFDDDHFDEFGVDQCLKIFMERGYTPDGNGGPFYIPGCPSDLRTVELWYQMQWYSHIIFPEGENAQ